MAKAVKLTRSQLYTLAAHATFATDLTIAAVAGDDGKTTVAWKPKPKPDVDYGIDRPMPQDEAVQPNGYIYHTIDKDGRMTVLKDGPK